MKSDGLKKRMAEALEAHFREPVMIKETSSVSGGCINQASRLSTSHGTFFAKSNDGAFEGLFSKEAQGLEAMAKQPSRLTLPEVIAFEDPAPGAPGFLLTTFLEPGRKVSNFEARLGMGLAEMHRGTSQEGFGFVVDTYCGTTIQPNGWMPDWVDFYRERRLEHLLRLGRDQSQYSRRDAQVAEQLLYKLEDRLDGPTEPPALIHGDLWSGNLHITEDGNPALIDPAVYYAHREAELGMMTLFGGFGPRVFEAYDEIWPLDPDWRSRNPLYELYHVMNHAQLFGGSYISQAMSIIRRFA